MGKILRVLHVFSIMNRGGAETMIMDLYRKIDREKIQFDFVVHTESEGAFDEEILELGGSIYRLPRYKGVNHVGYIKSWNDLIDNHLFDIVHGHVRSTATIYLSIAKKKGLTTIAHSHNTSNGNTIISNIKNIYQKPIRYIADYFLAASKDSGEWLFGEKIIQKNNFFILRNAIDISKYKFNIKVRENTRNTLQLNNKFVVGHIGNFKAQKNHKFLLSIFNELLKSKENSILLLIGEGNEKNEIEKLAMEMGIVDKIIFTGVRSDIPDLLQAMDVFVFPSLFEGLGIVTIESQAAGLHTIVSEGIPKEAFITSLIESINLDSPLDEWTQKILKYSERYEREDTSKEIAENGYDINQSAKHISDFYLKISGKYN